MTPRETLEKYGLKTDVKSIRERMEGRKHSELARSYILERDGHPLDEIDEALHEAYITMATVELRSADLSLLCELAEKGERAIELIKCNRRELNASLEESTSESSKSTYEFGLDLFDDLIDELEGDPK